MVTIEPLHHRATDSWKHFPTYLKRVQNFIDSYDSDVDGAILQEFLRINFVSNEATALMLVGLDSDDFVVGHCLAISERWFGKPVVTVVQLEVDRGTILAQAEWAGAMSCVRGFAHSRGAVALQLAARNRAAARLFRKYGFTETRVVMRQPVEGRASHPSS